ncbi:MAG: PaaI family thioesterase [Ruminococcaceae bacterium]|nr:PaaI family thioesterase [Oscillospiraceae bacterium]
METEKNCGELLEKARKVFADDVYAAETTGIVIEEVGTRYARCSLVPDKRHFNAAGSVMGGAIFTLADYAFAIASNLEEMNTTSLTSQISFLGAARGAKLFAEAKCIKSGRSTCCYVITVTDETGRDIASVTTTGFIMQPKA